MKQVKSISHKVQKEMPEFADEVAGLSVGELDTRLAQIAKNIEAIEESKEADTELESVKEEVRQRTAPYSEAKKALRLKSRYIIGLIKEKGGI